MAEIAFALLQIVPLPGEVLSFQREGVELCAYRFGEGSPYFFPVVGPAGRYVTRYGHPIDPVGHRHHRSVWIAHHDVAGHDFWSLGGKSGAMRQRRILRFEQEGETAAFAAELEWTTAEGEVLVNEVREVRVRLLPGDEYVIDLHLDLKPAAAGVKLEKTNYGPLGVRVAETMSVRNGGRVQLATGEVNEEQCLFKRADWCDYSGPVAPGTWNGIAILDHPDNPHHPPAWIMRNEGWMGPIPCHEEPVALPCEFRYRLYVHDGDAEKAKVAAQWEQYAAE
ncbi:MAG: PmoA family protein [Armatimonadota bacterium]